MRCSKLSTEEVQVRVIASGVGGITASDIQLAAASKAFVIGFNVRADAAARDAMKETGVEVRYYSIIYEAIDDVKQKMSGLLAPEIKETDRRRGAGARGVPLEQVRRGRRLPGDRGRGAAQQSDPRAARQRGDLRGRARVAATLQGRCQRGARRHRMRHRREELPGRAGRAIRSSASRASRCRARSSDGSGCAMASQCTPASRASPRRCSARSRSCCGGRSRIRASATSP